MRFGGLLFCSAWRDINERKGHFQRKIFFFLLDLFDPEGHRIRPKTSWTSTEKKRDAHWQAFGDSVKPGTWEVAIAGDIRTKKDSKVRVQVRFSGAKY